MNCAIVVNSTDSYEDTWLPFFTLFRDYWPQCPYPIYLNTETKSFSLPGLSVESTKVGKPGEPALDWSERSLRCLRKISEKYVLCLQDDYFLNGNVDGDLIGKILEVMEQQDWTCVRLMETGGNAGYRPAAVHPELFWEVHWKANYRIHTQALIWNRERLMSYLKPGETIWQFERFGTLRAHRIKDSFFCMNREQFNQKGRFPIPYLPTGVIKGKWYEAAVIPLFQEHGLNVDFSRRGFFRPTPYQKWVQRWRTRLRALCMRLR